MAAERDPIADLETRMAAAAEAGDYETAALLRDAIARLRAGTSGLTMQEPGRMGLGSSQERYVAKTGKPLPARPDSMTKNYKPGGRRR